MTYGFIGLGHLGARLAGSLARAGFDLLVYDLDPAAAAPLVAAGARLADSPADIAARCEAVDHLPAVAGGVRARARGAPGRARRRARRAGLDRDEHQRSRHDSRARGESRRARRRDVGMSGDGRRSPGGARRNHRHRRRRRRTLRAASAGARGDGTAHLPRRADRLGVGHQGDHQHARLHSSRRRRARR